MRKVAVIGSGFGGLALAIRLQSAGVQTTVYELRDKPGGRAYVYEQDGFTFDAGPTIITHAECLAELFQLSGRRMEDYIKLLPINPFYRLFWEDGYKFDYVNDSDLLLQQIKAKNPRDVDGYKRFLKYSSQVLEEGYIKLGTKPFPDFASMIRAAPQLIRLQSYRSVYSMVAKYIKDPQLREAFSFHSLLIGGHPFRSSSIYTLVHALERRWGVFFPEGGTGAMIKAMVKLLRDLNGEIKLSSPVAEVLTTGTKVTGLRLESGEQCEYDMVASNADIMHTYKNLLSNTKRGISVASKLQKSKFSPSLFVIYFGVSKKYDDLAHHTIIFGPRYKGLLDDIFFKKASLANDFSLYLHAPTVSDASLAPPGCTCFYVLSPVPHLGTADINWEEVGPVYRDTILQYLEDNYLPDLKANLVTTRIFTPFDFRDQLNAYLGSAFSLEPILTQSAYFRTHNRDDILQGLYFVGAGTHPGAGIPGVVASAQTTANLMLEDISIA